MLQAPTLIETRLDGLSRPLEEIAEFELAIKSGTDWDRVSGLGRAPAIKITARVTRWVGLLVDQLLRFVAPAFGKRYYLSIGYIAPHYLIYKTFPYFCIPGGLRIVWIYDAWENQLDAIACALRVHRINIAFVSSLQASQHFDQLGIKNFKSYWLPEAVTVSGYKSKPYLERSIDILQMGRRWNEYHFAIDEFCRENRLSYFYEKTPGEIIFPTRQAFVEGLANAKISICVPSAITHPARSGAISTVTWRYFQSMAAKCLILGKAPDEMKELFNYSPIVEIDMGNAREQLKQVLAQYATYIPLIERNYAFVLENHQWANRVDLMQKYLADFERTMPLSSSSKHNSFL